MDKREEIARVFSDKLLENFRQKCGKMGIEPTTENLILFMVQHNVVKEVTVKRYCVVEHFHEYLGRNDNHKGRAVWDLASTFGYEERSVYIILKKHLREFWRKCGINLI